MQRVWHLNFDADEELAGHQATAKRSLAMQAKLTAAVSALVAGDEVLDTNENYGGKAVGIAFMPTPRALSVLERCGLTTPLAPSFDVLRKANSRALSAGLGVALEGATFTTVEEEAISVLSTPSPSGTWLLKREFGFAGRGSKRFEGNSLTDDVRSFVRNSLEHGGLEITPWVTRLADFALHGFLRADGSYEEGSPTTQHCDKFGQWEQTVTATNSDLTTEEAHALSASLRESAVALHGIGYFGPFGIDGFRYVRGTAEGEEAQFCPRCEINARYTMGWAIGMGENRADIACVNSWIHRSEK